MKKFFATAVFFAFALALIAQSTVNGTVIDAESGEPLIGASIVIKGTTIGTVTDLDGNFEFQVENGDHILVMSYTGYATIEQSVNVSGATNLGSVELGFDAVGLKEVEVIASIAVDRRTPVAVTTLKGSQIEAKIGNQEFPEILRKTPSIYVTKEGGGFGDSRINVRGFDQRNTAVMINGIPVNDMENGWVYWSNWAGLADVTSSMQVQRGLGASKLAVPAVGGSINIVTNAADLRKGGTASVSIGNDGYQKYGLSLSSGLGEKGWAWSFQATHTRGDGYADGTMFRAYSYFASVTKQFNDKHMLSFTGLGAPQWHHQRFEPGSFDGVTLRTFVDPDDTKEDFTNMGTKFNWLFGELDGEEFSWRKNFYHKPKVFLNHYWTISPKTDLKTSAYISFGRGGGTGPRGRIRAPGSIFDTDFRTRDANGHVRFDDIIRYNQGATISGLGDPKEGFNGQNVVTSDGRIYFDDGSRSDQGSGYIRRASMNYHNWYGILSTLTTDLGNGFNLVGGIDVRYYLGEHFRRVENLLGADAYIARSDDNNPANLITTEDAADFGNFQNSSYKDGNNVLAYWNDGEVSWLGLFGQLEYTKNDLSAFLSLSASNQGFKRTDYFNYLESDPDRETDWQNFLGGTVKTGLNYNLDAKNNIFVNAGFFSRQPIFDNVFLNFVNDINEDIENQTVTAFEAGYGFRASKFNAKANVYYTKWGNRQFSQSVDITEDEEGLATFSGVEQTHIGLELELYYQPTNNLSFNGMLSAGDWKYTDNFIADVTNTDTGENLGKSTLYTDGIKVGDAAQFTMNIGATYQIVDGLRIFADWYNADNLYAFFDVTDDATNGFLFEPGNQVVELPSYSLVDAGISYNFDVSSTNWTLRFNMNNVLDEEYISEMNTNISDDPSTPNRNEFYDNRGIFGFGRTWSAGLKIRF